MESNWIEKKKATALLLAASLCIAGHAVGDTFGSAVNGAVTVNTDAGVALLKARGNTLGSVLGMTPGGGCSVNTNAQGSAQNRMDCARSKLEEKWEDSYGESIETSGLRLGVGYQYLRFKQGTSAEKLFEALNYLHAWAAQSARVAIASQMERSDSASAKALVPGTQENDQFGPELNKLKGEKDRVRHEIAKLMEQIDPYEAAAVESELRYLEGSPSFGDRAERFVDGLIKKIDSSYDEHTFSKNTRDGEGERHARMQKKANELRTQLAMLETHQRELAERIKNESVVGSFGVEGSSTVNAALAGVTVISTHENVNVEQGFIEVAVLSAWSPELEKIGLSILTGQQVKVADQAGPKFLPNLPKIKTANEYLLNLPIEGLNGSHLVINKNGQYEILGVSVFPLKRGSLSSRDSLRSSRFFARMHMNCAIYSKTIGIETVKGGLRVRENDYQVAGRGSQTDTQTSCGTPADESNRKVFGEKDVMSSNFVHPSYGFPAVIQAYKLDAVSSEITRNILRKNKSLHMQAIKSLQYQDGYDQAVELQLDQAKMSTVEKQRGMSDAISSFNRKMEQPAIGAAESGTRKRQAASYSNPGVMRSYSGGRGTY